MPDPLKTKYHRDGSVTFWNVLEQGWTRTHRPTDAELATLSADERAKIERHRTRHGCQFYPIARGTP